MAFDYKAAQISRAFVFGSVNPSSTDYQSHIQRQDRPENLLPRVAFNTSEYMSEGPGRFVTPYLFDVVQEFFNDDRRLKAVRTFEQAVEEAGGRGSDQIGLSNYATQSGIGDHSLRSYISGTSSFILEGDESTRFVFDGRKRRIEGNLFIRPLEDNFDFIGGGDGATLVGQLAVQPIIDPYKIGEQPVFLDSVDRKPTLEQGYR